MTNSRDSIPGPFPLPTAADEALSSYLAAHPRLTRALSRVDARELIATVGGLLTTPAWQASTLRLEVLQHLAVICQGGTNKLRTGQLKSWLSQLGNGMPGRLEDPVEDVFVSRVFSGDDEFLVINGLSEGSAFLLQRFLNILRRMPSREPYQSMRKAAQSLLR